MCERDVRRLDGQGPDRLDEAQRLLRGEAPLRVGCERCRADPEVALALAVEPLAQPDRCVLHPPILGEAPRELLGRLLGLELGELGLLLGEEVAGLQLEQRRDQDEKLAAGVEVELVALRESLDERDDDPGHVDLRRLDRILEQKGEEKVERPLERIEVQLEIADGSGHGRPLAPGSDAALRHGHLRPGGRWRIGQRRLAESQYQRSPAMRLSPADDVLSLTGRRGSRISDESDST